ncbi:LysR family transcriptional regulator [Methylovirgula sp. 4M-Z18]|uniref:LysR family transcriptional regulator n=1 Tax=Methylovirgula sp. 4M-Z18 TaxID=2293567 RepID=UPI000E2FD40B|nr:LysR family transcriptional regulator [Methylovirgula sp. 4M-Z18]RFB78657.1 LysR family transcriptional regulator [Methylovirgula sp. 4M-Z18]
MNLQDIEAFVAVAETGSVNRAAVRLNLTQPAVTRRVQNFEAAMKDAPIFNREVKPAVLTALGVHVLAQCRDVLTAVAKLQASTTKHATPVGELKIGVAHGLGGIVLTSPLDALRRGFPQIKLQIGSNWTRDLIEDMRSGSLDCSVGLLTDDHIIPNTLVRHRLGAEQVVVVSANKAATKANGAPWHLRDLADEGWFLNPHGCGCRAFLMKSYERQQLPLHIIAEVFGEDLQLSLLAHSGGLSLIPRRQFYESSHRHHLQILEVCDFALPMHVTLIRQAAPGRFDAVTDLLTTELRAKLS